MKPLPNFPDEADVVAENAQLKKDCVTLRVQLTASGVKIPDMPTLNDGNILEYNTALHVHLAQLKAIDRGVPATPKATSATNAASKPTPKQILNPKPSEVPKPRPTAVKADANLSLDDRVAIAKGGSATPKRTRSFDELVTERKKQTNK